MKIIHGDSNGIYRNADWEAWESWKFMCPCVEKCENFGINLSLCCQILSWQIKKFEKSLSYFVIELSNPIVL